MRKDLTERMTKAFAALTADVQKNPGNLREAQNLLKDLQTEFRTFAAGAYTASVAARKAERDEKRANKVAAIEEARAVRDEAKAKFAAALAIRVNGKVATRRAKKEADPLAAAMGEVNPTTAIGALADLPPLEDVEQPEIF